MDQTKSNLLFAILILLLMWNYYYGATLSIKADELRQKLADKQGEHDQEIEQLKKRHQEEHQFIIKAVYQNRLDLLEQFRAGL